MTIRLYRTFDPKDNEIFITDDDAHYLRHVLRVSIGDKIVIFNGIVGAWMCEVSKLDKKICSLIVVEQITKTYEEPVTHLYCAALKSDAMNFVFEKGCELGVTHFSIIQTDFTQKYKLNKEKIEKQLKNSVQQCERLSLPDVIIDTSFQKALEELVAFKKNGGQVFVALERSNAKSMIDVFKNKSLVIKENSPCAILIGPEGGFSERERVYLEKIAQELHIISLSSNILRAETAALSALALVASWRVS